MALSDNLRERVGGGGGRRHVAQRGSQPFCGQHRQRRALGGASKPKGRSRRLRLAPTGRDRRSGRIEAHRDYLLGLVRRRPLGAPRLDSSPCSIPGGRRWDCTPICTASSPAAAFLQTGLVGSPAGQDSSFASGCCPVSFVASSWNTCRMPSMTGSCGSSCPWNPCAGAWRLSGATGRRCCEPHGSSLPSRPLQGPSRSSIMSDAIRTASPFPTTACATSRTARSASLGRTMATTIGKSS